MYGREGHRQRKSFSPSHTFSTAGATIEVINADKTGTNDYTLICITCNTEEECDAELDAQLSDGIFECCNYGKIVIY